MKLKFELDNVIISNLNFNEICRFCLSNRGILLPIFRLNEDHKKLPSQIKSILSIEMEEDDGLPSMICHSCLINVERSIDFKNQCERADSILRNYLNNAKSQHTQNEMRDISCQAEITGEESCPNSEPDDSQPTTELKNGVHESDGADLTEDNKTNMGTESDENRMEDGDTGRHGDCEGDVEGGEVDVLQMEESMNDMEEGMITSEPFSLDLCSVRLQSEGAAEDMADQWSDSGSDISDDLDNIEPVIVTVEAGNCTGCNKSFGSQEDLLRHQLIHKQEPPFPCDYCDQQFEEKTLLKAHWRSHANSKQHPHMCLTCGEAFGERADLVKHFAIHDVIKPYHCPGCGKAFAYRSDLRKHAIIHTGARPFKCPVCHKTFTRSTNLNKHARVHTGRRPYPCDHCDKMFSSRGDLVRHSVIHTGEKPYACLICSLAFNRKDKLSRHERVHMTDRPFVCPECPTSFHRKEELTKHIRFHHFKPDPEFSAMGQLQGWSEVE